MSHSNMSYNFLSSILQLIFSLFTSKKNICVVNVEANAAYSCRMVNPIITQRDPFFLL